MDTTHSAKTFADVSTPEQLETLVGQSNLQPVVIFKHSPTCGTSAFAYDELESYLQAEPEAEVFLVNVLANRSLSQAIATRFKIHHESPQVIVLRSEHVSWHASHYRVTADSVRRARAAAL